MRYPIKEIPMNPKFHFLNSMRLSSGFQGRCFVRFCDGAPGVRLLAALLLAALFFLGGCAGMEKTIDHGSAPAGAPVETILSGKTGEPLTYRELIERLAEAKIIYVGEIHTQPEHHRIQLRILQDLAVRHPDLRLGVEMIDKSYQPVLDTWITGEKPDREWFLEKTHWYANWRFPFDLYADIFLFARDRRIPLFGLNLPFHIPPKIAIAGLDSLMISDASFLPKHIDLSSAAHRSYVHDIYEKHRKSVSLKDHFEYFYQAQCAWEDTMAESIAVHAGKGPMIVLAGNGHIVYKFGIPDRAFARTGLPFATVYLTTEEEPTELGIADYIWKLPKSAGMRAPHPATFHETTQEKP